MSEANVSCRCSFWNNRASNELFPLWFDPRMNEWSLLHSRRAAGFGSLIFRFCPSCGRSMPGSLRAGFFTKPDEAELREAQALIAGVSSPLELKSRLGPADQEFSWPASFPVKDGQPSFKCQYTYSRRWKTLELVAQEGTEGAMEVWFSGRYRPEGGAV